MKALERVLTSRRFFWLVLGAGGVLRMLWALYFDPNPVNDGKWYMARSSELAEGLGYQVNGLPTAYWPVGYPAALGIAFRMFGAELVVMRVLQALLGVLCLFAVHEVTRRACDSLIAARAAMLLLAIYPGDIAYTSVMLSEPSYNAWMMSGMAVGLSSLQWRLRVLLAALLFALAALTKPQGLLLPIVFGLFAAGSGRAGIKVKAVNTASCVLIMCAALSPWWIRNALAFEAFVPVSNNGGVNLFIGNNPKAQGGYRFSEKVERGGQAEYDSSEQFARRAREYIGENLHRTVRLWPRKVVKLLEADVAPFSWSRSIADHKRATLEQFVPFNDIYYRWLWVGALAGWLLAWRPHRVGFALLFTGLAVVLCWWATGTWLPGVIAGGLGWLASDGSRFHAMRLRVLPTCQVLIVLVITVVYFGDFRFHHAMMPWAVIFAGHLIATTLTGPLSRTTNLAAYVCRLRERRSTERRAAHQQAVAHSRSGEALARATTRAVA